MCVCVYVCVCVWGVCVCVCVGVWVCVCVCGGVGMYVRTYVCVCGGVFIYVRTYIIYSVSCFAYLLFLQLTEGVYHVKVTVSVTGAHRGDYLPGESHFNVTVLPGLSSHSLI